MQSYTHCKYLASGQLVCTPCEAFNNEIMDCCQSRNILYPKKCLQCIKYTSNLNSQYIDAANIFESNYETYLNPCDPLNKK